MKTLSVGRQPDLTTIPVHVTPSEVTGFNPEWLDSAGVEARFSIRRSLLYQLLDDGLVKSISLRRRNCLRGKRLFSVDSIRAWLSARPTDIHPGWSKLSRKAQLESVKSKKRKAKEKMEAAK